MRNLMSFLLKDIVSTDLNSYFSDFEATWRDNDVARLGDSSVLRGPVKRTTNVLLSVTLNIIPCYLCTFIFIRKELIKGPARFINELNITEAYVVHSGAVRQHWTTTNPSVPTGLAARLCLGNLILFPLTLDDSIDMV